MKRFWILSVFILMSISSVYADDEVTGQGLDFRPIKFIDFRITHYRSNAPLNDRFIPKYSTNRQVAIFLELEGQTASSSGPMRQYAFSCKTKKSTTGGDCSIDTSTIDLKPFAGKNIIIRKARVDSIADSTEVKAGCVSRYAPGIYVDGQSPAEPDQHLVIEYSFICADDEKSPKSPKIVSKEF